MTWTELGVRAGRAMRKGKPVSPFAMSDIKREVRDATVRELEAFAQVLGVRFAWLAIGEEPMVGEPHANPGPRVVAQDVSFGDNVDVPIPPRHEPKRRHGHGKR
jgi:hypothetical protein